MAGLETTQFHAFMDTPNVLSTNANSLPVSSLHSQVSLQLKPQFKQLDLKQLQITYSCGDTHLERAHYLRFQKQASKGKIDPDRLPPTENATAQHSLCVHLQVAVWKHLNTSVLEPIGRGWELDGNKKLRPKINLESTHYGCLAVLEWVRQ